jgi:hypothetical protein
MKVLGKYINNLFLIFFIIPIPVCGINISGVVSDKSGEELPFATIYIKETGFGTTTNLDGNYEFSLDPGNYTLIFQYLGYKTESRNISVEDEDIRLDVRLEEQSYVLPDLTYISGEDPAYAIMRKVIAKSKYHLYQLESYKTNVYVKGSGRIVKVPFLFRKRLEKEGIDSSRVFTVESLTELSYELPNKYTERILSINTNIEDDAPSPMPYIKASFYEPKVADALSPIAPNAFSHYKYRYDGAFSDNEHTVFKIYVQPRIKGDQVFEGYLYIIEDLWAIHSLNFNVYIQGFKAAINQIYKPIESQIWMPVTLKFDVTGSFMGFKLEFNYAAINNDYEVTINKQFVDDLDSTLGDPNKNLISKDVRNESLSNITIDQDLSKKEMRKKMKEYEKQALEAESGNQDIIVVEQVDIDSMAYKKDSAYWAKIRPIPLTTLELKNYQARDSLLIIRKKEERKDSLKRERNKTFRPEHVIIGNDYQLSERSTLIWHPLWTKISYNTVEGVNIHADLDYRLELDSIKNITIGTNNRYAFSSKRWNGLLFVRYDFKKHMQYGHLQLEGGRYISQLNMDNPIPNWWNMLNTLFIRKNYMKLFERDYVDLKLRLPLTSKFITSMLLNLSEKRSLENTSDFSFFNREAEFTPNNPTNIILEDTRFQPYNLIAAGLTFEYMPFLKYTISNGIKSIIKNSSPVFSVGYKYAGTYNSSQNYNYNYLFADIKFGNKFGVGNRFDLVAGAGIMFKDGELDFPEYIHFMGNQTILITGDLFNSYRMLPYYYYSTNKYWFKAHTYYQFRKLLVTQVLYARIAGLREDLYFNYLYSNVLHNYYEIGYAIDNIFRFLRLEVVGQFIGSNYEGIGFRIGISKNIVLE